MSKFQVGDKVKIVTDRFSSPWGKDTQHVVIDVFPGRFFPVQLGNGSFRDSELELVERITPAFVAGAWTVGDDIDAHYVSYIFDNELDALRKVNEQGHGKVRFAPFGKEVSSND